MHTEMLVVDREDRPLLLVVLRDREVLASDLESLVHDLNHRFPEAVPYGMVASPESIVVVGHEPADPDSPLLELPATPVFLRYDPEFLERSKPYGSLGTFRFYLFGLVRGWVDDLGYHWKFTDPPAAAEFRRIGLLERLEGALILEESSAGGYPLR